MLNHYQNPYVDYDADAPETMSASSEDDAEAASLERLLAANPFSALSPSVYSEYLSFVTYKSNIFILLDGKGNDDLSYAARKTGQDNADQNSSSSSSSSDSDLAKMERNVNVSGLSKGDSLTGEDSSQVGPLPSFKKQATRRRRMTAIPRRAFYKEYTPEHAEVCLRVLGEFELQHLDNQLDLFQVLRHLTALCNTVAYKESHKFLIRKKHSEPHLFQSVGLWLRIHKRMLKLHFPLATRRVIDNLFDYVFLDFDALDYLDNLR